jgi:cob(I)alamin adenosyltransferase
MGKKQKIYTKTGDDGTTGLFAGSRVKKNNIRLETYGTLDEINAYLGVIRSFGLKPDINKILVAVQEKIFTICAKLASDDKGRQLTEPISFSENDVKMLEEAIDLYEQNLPELKNFIIPGDDQLGAFCHVARTVCRRAERQMVHFAGYYPLPMFSLEFINRLSDFLFVLSRKVAYDKDSTETFWRSK